MKKCYMCHFLGKGPTLSILVFAVWSKEIQVKNIDVWFLTVFEASIIPLSEKIRFTLGTNVEVGKKQLDVGMLARKN